MSASDQPQQHDHRSYRPQGGQPRRGNHYGGPPRAHSRPRERYPPQGPRRDRSRSPNRSFPPAPAHGTEQLAGPSSIPSSTKGKEKATVGPWKPLHGCGVLHESGCRLCDAYEAHSRSRTSEPKSSEYWQAYLSLLTPKKEEGAQALVDSMVSEIRDLKRSIDQLESEAGELRDRAARYDDLLLDYKGSSVASAGCTAASLAPTVR